MPVKSLASTVFDNPRLDLASALQHSHDYGLSDAAALFESASDLLGLVHIASLTADEGFVNLDLPGSVPPASVSCIPSRMRWSMNQAVFWVTPKAR